MMGHPIPSTSFPEEGPQAVTSEVTLSILRRPSCTNLLDKKEKSISQPPSTKCTCSTATIPQDKPFYSISILKPHSYYTHTEI